ncbi:uncharacterized protein LOC121705614 [Alosa sapidissima]|uniref:uncharacterized protein LOC121705614 n=1 Tax=Alosa sapidissima TaxID=34773 RepID=UPI001C0A15FD|nr:uncharacterized protein LOC121705614 [Alosa sapidissima]
MATNINKTTPSAIMERAEGDGGYEVGTQHHSKLLVEQAWSPHKIRESLGRDDAEVELEASDLKELNEYFTALEKSRRNLQQLLQEEREEQVMELRALERERVQERAEWERERVEREEALLSALISMAISRQKLMKEIRSQPATLYSPSSSACKDMEADQLILKQLMELESKVREAEGKKQLKALAKAEKKARKVERRSGKNKAKKTQKKDDQVKAIKPKRCWHRCILTLGCVTSTVEN